MKTPKLLKATASAFGLARKATDAEAIEAAIVEARALVAEGEAAEAEAQGRYRDALLADDGDPAAALADMQAAKIRRDRGEAQAAELTVRLAAVRETAEQDRRRTTYDSALAKAEAARAALLQDYPAIARQTLALLRTLAEAEIAVKQANTALPTGSIELVSPETEVRSAAWMPIAEETSEPMDLWAPANGIAPLPDDEQGMVQRASGPYPWKGLLTREDGSRLNCERRTYRRIVTRERPSDDYRSNLAGGINLPALHPHTSQFWSLDRGPYNVVNSLSPEATLDALAQVEPLNAAVWRRPDPADFIETVRFEEVRRPVEAEQHAGF